MRNKMFCTAACLSIGLLACPTFAATSAASNTGDQYLMAVADYFEVSYEDVFSNNETLTSGEIPVAFYIAQRTNIAVDSVIRLRQTPLSWVETASRLGLNAACFYVMVTGEITSKTFAPIFEKFSTTSEQNWRKLELSDNEVVNLVNLRVMYSQYDYSVYEVMAFRDANKSWDNVNKLVAEAKNEFLKKEMAEQN